MATKATGCLRACERAFATGCRKFTFKDDARPGQYVSEGESVQAARCFLKTQKTRGRRKRRSATEGGTRRCVSGALEGI